MELSEAKKEIKQSLNRIILLVQESIPEERGARMNDAVGNLYKKAAEFQMLIDDLLDDPSIKPEKQIKGFNISQTVVGFNNKTEVKL